MPFQPSSPNTEQVPVATPQLMGVMKIHELVISLDPNDQGNPQVTVNYSEGYMSGEIYMALRHHKAVMKGANVVSKITEVTTGETVYDEVKERCWQLLQTEPANSEIKYVGTGTIS